MPHYRRCSWFCIVILSQTISEMNIKPNRKPLYKHDLV